MLPVPNRGAEAATLVSIDPPSHIMSDPTAPTTLPLEGIRVLEFCQTIMGPSAGLMLADLGADVLKIEPAPGGDRTRRLPGFAAGFFGSFNRNKRSVALDLKQDAGRALAHRLAETADVVIENYAPGTMERLGCGADDLMARNPRLIYCALKGFLSGPYEKRAALDEVVQFMGGLAYMTGPPGRPLRAGTSVIDIYGGTMGVLGILCALRERDRTGRGQVVKSALFESTVFLVGQHLAGETVTGRPMPPMPAREGAWGIYEPFETADGQQIFIGITSNNHWRWFCEAFDRTDLRDDPRYEHNEDRVRERATLIPIVAEIVRQRPMADLLAVCERIGIPFAPVATPSDLFNDPHLNAGGRLMDVDLGGGLHTRLPKLPLELDGREPGLRRQPPAVGQHTREVLAEAGLDDRELAELEARGIIVAPKPANPRGSAAD